MKSTKTFLFAAVAIGFILGSSTQAYLEVIDLGTLGGNFSEASSINDNGQIVGWAYNSSDWDRACLFDPIGQGNNIDLNTLIDPSSGWILNRAFSINNNGWIVGQGTHNGQTRAFLLTPEPATLLLLGLGSLAAMRRRRAL